MKRNRSAAFGNRNYPPRKGRKTDTRVAPPRPTSKYVVPGYTRSAGAYARSAPGSVAQKKYLDTAQVQNSIATAGTVCTSFCLVPQGTTDVTRIGNKIKICNLDMKFALSLDDETSPTTAVTSANIRMIVYIDKQTNGAAAAVTDVLTSATIGSFRNMDTVDRFKILWDKNFNLTPRTAYYNSTGNERHVGVGAFFWKKKRWNLDLPVHYSSTTGAITELKSNNIGCIVITDLANCNMNLNTRIKYYDA